MLDEEVQWLISLSAVSLIGPRWDVDRLKHKGFYKHPDKDHQPLDLSLGLEVTSDQAYEEARKEFLKSFNIDSREAYYQVLDGFFEGSKFAVDMARLMQIGKAMGKVDREKKQSFLINGHLYLHDTFQLVMQYEFHWPPNGLSAYDLSNAIMLLRLGLSQAYIEEDAMESYLDKLLAWANRLFQEAKSYGEAVEIGRQIHCKYLKSIGAGGRLVDEKDHLCIAYYSIWQNMKHVWPKSKAMVSD